MKPQASSYVRFKADGWKSKLIKYHSSLHYRLLVKIRRPQYKLYHGRSTRVRRPPYDLCDGRRNPTKIKGKACREPEKGARAIRKHTGKGLQKHNYKWRKVLQRALCQAMTHLFQILRKEAPHLFARVNVGIMPRVFSAHNLVEPHLAAAITVRKPMENH